MPGDPGDQMVLILLGKFHDQAVVIDGLPQLFHPLVRLPGCRGIGEYHGAVIGNVRKGGGHPVPVAFRQLEQVNVLHLNQGMLRHHGKPLHRVGKGSGVKVFGMEPMEVKGFRQRVQEQLFHLAQVVLQQEQLLSVEHVQPSQLLIPKLQLELVQCVLFWGGFCHGITS